MSIRSNISAVCRTLSQAENRIAYVSNVVKYTVFQRLLRLPVSLPLRPNLTLIADGRSASTGCAVLFDLYYEPRLMLFMDDWLKDDSVFIDVGANIGIYSLLAARHIGEGRVIAIEANPKVFKKLATNVAANQFPNISLVNCAVTAEAGKLSFDLADGDCEGKIDKGNGSTSKTASIEIEGLPLPAILQQAGVDRISCIKLDVEGAELDVLIGARSIIDQDKPVILIDYYDRPIADYLSELGYLPYRYQRHLVSPTLNPVDPEASHEHGSIFLHNECLESVHTDLRIAPRSVSNQHAE